MQTEEHQTPIAATSRHNLPTRLVHAGLALAVVTQLLTSLVLQPAEDGHAGNFWFEIHEYGGLSAFALIVLFWIVLTARRRGTPAGLLFPWVSGERLSALWSDIVRYAGALRRLRLPPHDDASPLASAVHGLGILLITAMATSGTLYYFIGNGNPDAGGLVGATMFVHRTLANLAWAYLIGHASMAVLQHLFTDFNLRGMWSLHTAPKKEATK
ncbi:cytochrome b/b6 domain-containing protein [Palleronia sp. LCG004]|uniref:cytochrome b/b6 domain-containing protein n=1 Tax=Palleronia sp. LCG004 TaxID=3079304 RepID=UPI00294307DC|nr:cytochrome b/b6 domain-containing protein [Palleronia sp. LCG004]WOI56679.1 cytochrome b/b6 domain-containing protein [Palleronia sp. LCG004]